MKIQDIKVGKQYMVNDYGVTCNHNFLGGDIIEVIGIDGTWLQCVREDGMPQVLTARELSNYAERATK